MGIGGKIESAAEKPLDISGLPDDVQQIVKEMRALKTVDEWINLTKDWHNTQKNVLLLIASNSPKERERGMRKFVGEYKEDIGEGTDREENLDLKLICALCCLTSHELKLAQSALWWTEASQNNPELDKIGRPVGPLQ